MRETGAVTSRIHRLRSQTPGDPSLSEVATLGLIQGPAELLPVSSSAHLSLVPWLMGWSYLDLDPELRKSVEVALHAGTALALLLGQRDLMVAELRALDGRRLVFLALSFAPAAVVGLTFERLIERHLGGPGATAAGLTIGSLAMAAADRRPGFPSRQEPDWQDGLSLGIAQAAALVPGISRNGATLAAARARGFDREEANRLSRIIALPVIAGASLLKGIRLARRGTDASERKALATGVVASFISTLASQRLIRLVERDRALWPYSLYRLALAALVLITRRHRHN